MGGTGGSEDRFSLDQALLGGQGKALAARRLCIRWLLVVS